MTDNELELKYEENYQNFITGLEKLSKKYGIIIKGCGCFPIWSADGFKKVRYERDSSSGDLRMLEVIGHDGTDMIKWWEKNYC